MSAAAFAAATASCTDSSLLVSSSCVSTGWSNSAGNVFGEGAVVRIVVAGLVIILGPVGLFGKVLVIISFGVIPFE